jgi:hypothetical protein
VCSGGNLQGKPTLAGIVRDYIENGRDGAEDELSFFRARETFRDAVRKAALAEAENGKRLAHQRRIAAAVLRECAEHLEAALPRLVAAPTFEALHDIVREEIGGVRGVGNLTVYDTALRMAAWRRLEPERVFLHAGTRVGARLLGLDATAESLAIGELPEPFCQLRPREIEDVLCIYKDALGSL